MASRRNESYDSITAEIERLVQKQESMKSEKLDVMLNQFQKEFKKKDFQNLVLNTDNAALRESVKFFVRNFKSFKL